MKQLQEKLNHLVHCMSFQNVRTEDLKYQQALESPHVLENNASDSSSNSEETDRSSPVDAFNVTWDLVDIIGNQDSLIQNEVPDTSTGEQVALQDRSLCSQGSLYGCSRDLSHTQGTKPLKKVLRTMDLSSWSSPEVVRKDSISERPPSLPLTPCLDALSQCSLDTSLWDGTSTQLLQADQLGLLCYSGESAAGTAPKWAGSPLAADGAPSIDHHAQRVPVVSGLPGCCPGLGPWDAQGPSVFPLGCVYVDGRVTAAVVVGSPPVVACWPGLCEQSPGQQV